MTEAIELKPVETVEKPYQFRQLGAPDIFLMFKIIKAIGVNEFMDCLESDSLRQAAAKMISKSDAVEQDEVIMMGALAGTLEIVNVIVGNLPKCEKEIYQLLEQTSNLTVKEITKPGNAVMFVEMVVDFLKKEEFRDFIKVVSKLF